MNWIYSHFLLVLPLVLCAGGVLWLMPQANARPRIVGALMGLSGLGILALTTLNVGSPDLFENVMFGLCAPIAVISAVMMITNRNPVYSALWFALVTLGTCGLFLAQSAPFLAAATIIVYAGAIIVTFLFVIMLAQQTGIPLYDHRARQPLAAVVAGFLLLGGLLSPLQTDKEREPLTQQLLAGVNTAEVKVVTNPLSQPVGGEKVGEMRGLGRSLFGDYLYTTELAGTLLLIASIGAIAIAPRRSQGTL